MSSGLPRGRYAVQPPELRRENLATSVARILRRYILVERLEAGAALPPERELADSLNVSRTVLREALSQLIGEGVVERSGRRPVRVKDFDRGRLAADVAPGSTEDLELRDLIELRAIIELGAIEVVAHRVTLPQLAEIETWVVEGERRVQSGDPLGWVDAHFHAALLRTLGNQSVDAFLPLIEENLRQNILVHPRQLTSTGDPDDYRVSSEHRQVFEAIKRRDALAARLVMRAHLGPYLRREDEADIRSSTLQHESIEEKTTA